MTRKEARVIQACAWCIIGIGVVVGIIRFINTPGVGRNVETVLAAVALGGIVALPGGIAHVASRNRPALLWVLGLILAPLSLLSFAGVLLPLLIPAFIFFRIALNYRQNPARMSIIGANGIVFILMLAAVFALFITTDAREYYDPVEGAGYGTSDEIATHESVLALLLAGAAVGAAVVLVKPISARLNLDVQPGT